MKKTIALLTVSAMVLALCACGGSAKSETSSASKAASETKEASQASAASQTEEASAQETAGGWAITENQAVSLPEGVKEAFEKAGGESKGLTPIAYIASQVVAGTNYMVLCNNGSGYQMAVIYADLKGNAEITNIKDFDLLSYVGTDKEADNEVLAGGWIVPEDLTVLEMPQDAQDAFKKAMEGFVGSNVEPMALLATQVVSGINYAVLARVTPVTADPVSSVQVLTIYADLQDNAKITNFAAIDPKEYNQ